MFSLVILFVILLIASAFFSASETALFSISAVQIHKLKDGHSQTAKLLVASLKDPRKILITILLGNELVNVCMSIIGAAVISQMCRASATTQTIIAVAIVTPIILIAGEIVPKNIAIHYAAQIAPVVIWPLRAFYIVVRPLRLVLHWVADRVIVLLGGEPKRSEPMIMEDEFRRLVDLGSKEGVIVEEERDLIHNVFEFTDKVAGDIMTPEEKIFSLDAGIPFERILEEIKTVQFSRVPFYEGENDNWTGVLHVRDMFSFHRKMASGESVDIREILRLPLLVDVKTPLEALLREFQRSQMHMAIVMDGATTAGVVTMDDVLEALFGEMEQ